MNWAVRTHGTLARTGWPTFSGAAVLAVALAASAQTIQIPDLGETPPTVAPSLKPGEVCVRCGTIISIRELPMQRPVNVPQDFRSNPGYSGPVGNNPVGAVISIPFGSSSTASEKPFVGGVGTPEMRARFSETHYNITIRLDDGGYTEVQRRDGYAYKVGDRVRVEGIRLELLAP